MTPRQKRRFLRQFQAQVEQERNGKPVDPEIAARMTKPKDPDQLWQVMATLRESGKQIAVGPMMLRPYAEELAATINRFVIEGKERVWSNASVVPLTPIIQGVS